MDSISNPSTQYPPSQNASPQDLTSRETSDLSQTRSPPFMIRAQRATIEAFAPFGSLIMVPLSRDIQSLDILQPGRYSDYVDPPSLVPANGNTALKSRMPWELINNYDSASSQKASKCVINTFTCFPQIPWDRNLGDHIVDPRVLERHPFTTQTFIPVTSTDSDDPSVYLVIVAPNHPSSSNVPNIKGAKAFVVTRGQAVTYAPGTWHSPMIVLGPERMDFMVVQYVNEIPTEDCDTLPLNPEELTVVLSNEPRYM